MRKYFAVKYPTSARTYTHHCDVPGVKAGDMVIVETAKGSAKVEVVGVVPKPQFATKGIEGLVKNDVPEADQDRVAGTTGQREG